MAQDQETNNSHWWRKILDVPSESEGKLHSLLRFSIRGKIILPYLVLTLVVAIIGTYVVTNLVAGSLDERLTNQLLEAGRVVSDAMARQELSHLETARSIAFTSGLAEALEDGDRESVAALARPTASVRGVDCLIILNEKGGEVLHILQQESGFRHVEGRFETSRLWIVQALLEAGDPNASPRRSLVLHRVDENYYYFTAIPVEWEDEAIGVVVVGTSFDNLLPHLKATALADVTFYLDGGRAIASTFVLAEQTSEPSGLLDDLSIPSDLYQQVVHDTDSTVGVNVRLRGRSYRLAHGPLRVGEDSLGVFSVALPSNFIVRAGATSRNTYAAIFFAAMVCVVLVGYFISQRITRPLDLLVRTSQAVAEGNLQQRTGIERPDEIGTLATTFDQMTGRLAQRTYALEEALSRMRAILSSIGDGVILETLDGDFVPLNIAAERMLEELAESFMLKPLQETPESEPGPNTDSESDAWLADRRRFEVGDKVISTNSATVETEDGEHLGKVIVLRDITAEAEAEQLKDAFITHVSHELRTPLTAIKGYSDLLLASTGDALDENQRQFLKTIRRHTDSLITMINALLDFSELEAWGSIGLRRRPVPPSSMVGDIVEQWRPQMQDKGLTLRVEVADDLPRIDADAKRLHCALVNLVRNAWQYTPPDGSIELRVYAQDGNVVFDVADTGVGISPEEQEFLFTRFYRVAWAGSDEDERGLGLGLYVARAIVEAHDGEIRVESEEGEGSTFSVFIPAFQDDEAESR